MATRARTSKKGMRKNKSRKGGAGAPIKKTVGELKQMIIEAGKRKGVPQMLTNVSLVAISAQGTDDTVVDVTPEQLAEYDKSYSNSPGTPAAPASASVTVPPVNTTQIKGIFDSLFSSLAGAINKVVPAAK